MENAVIGVFDEYSHARDAAEALRAEGFRDWAVQLTPQEESLAARQTAMDDRERYSSSEGWSIGNFFRSLFGMDAEHEHAHAYSEALRRGSFLVTVEAEREEQLQRAHEVMARFHPIDIEERAAHWRSQGWSRYEPHAGPFTDEQVRAERGMRGTAGSATDATSGQRGNSAVRSFQRTQGGASPGGGSDMGSISGGSMTGDMPAMRMNPSDTDGVGSNSLLSGSDSMMNDSDTSRPAAPPAAGTGMPRSGSMSDMAAMSGMTGTHSTELAGSRSAGDPDAGTGSQAAARGSQQQGVSGSGSSDEGGWLSAGSGLGSGGGAAMGTGGGGQRSDMRLDEHRFRNQEAERTQSVQRSMDVGGGAGFGADDASAATGSGGTLGSMTTENADLHESSRPGMAGTQASGASTGQSQSMSTGSMMGDSMGAGSMSAGAGTDGMMGASAAGMAADTGPAIGDNRQIAADEHRTSGTMSNAAMRDSTAPDIYHVDTDADYRTHWQKAYGMEGRYEDFAPHYRFGAELRNNAAFRGYHNWNDVEPEARRSWESNNEGSAWDKARDAVRHGWERIKD